MRLMRVLEDMAPSSVSHTEINTDEPDVVDVVYVKGGRRELKPDFHDGFTAIRPSIFGTIDEAHHSLRRQQIAHAVSEASLVMMEHIFDQHIKTLIEKREVTMRFPDVFDFTDVLKSFSQDCNGDFSLGIQFKTQDMDDPTQVPPLNAHIALARLTGYVPWIRGWFNKFGSQVPWPCLQRLLRSKAWKRGEAE